MRLTSQRVPTASMLGLGLAFLGTAALVNAQVPSSTPRCYVCPDEDLAGFVLTRSDFTNAGVGAFKCVYGEPWNCVYQASNGALLEDANEELCLPVATFDCTATRRRRNENALPRRPYPPSTTSQEPKPESMRLRAKLKKAASRVVKADY